MIDRDRIRHAPIVLGGQGRHGEQLVSDLEPLFDLVHVAHVSVLCVAYVLLIFFSAVGIAHIARVASGAAP